jgi:hypothetical protein
LKIKKTSNLACFLHESLLPARRDGSKSKMKVVAGGDVRDSGGSLVANPERPVWNGGLRVAVHILIIEFPR